MLFFFYVVWFVYARDSILSELYKRMEILMSDKRNQEEKWMT